MPDPLRIALLGYGLWGRNILRELKALGHAITVAEPDPTRRADALAAGASTAITDAAALPSIHGIIVATPASTHADVVLPRLPHNVPMLVEKPLTTDVASARAIVATGGAHVFVGHVWCYHPGIEALAEISRRGELGPVTALRSTRTNWTSPRTDVDTTWNLAPHDLSIAQFLLGEIPTPRFAVAERDATGRCVGLIATLGESPSFTLEVSNRHREKRREVRLHCRDGVAVLADPDAGAIEITRSGPRGEAILETRAHSRESALRRELAAFCAHCAGGPRMRTTVQDGLAVVESIVALRRLAGLE